MSDEVNDLMADYQRALGLWRCSITEYEIGSVFGDEMADGGRATQRDATDSDRPPTTETEPFAEHIRVKWHRHSQLSDKLSTPHT
jgi:hypothetical protein